MTPKQIAAGQVRSLRAIRNKLQNMAEKWEDVDEFNISQFTELADQVENVAIKLVDSQEVE